MSIQDTIDDVDDYVSLRKPVIERLLLKRNTSKVLGILVWIPTVLVFTLLIMVFNATKKVIEYSGNQIRTETVTIRDTVVVTRVTDVCPRCRHTLPFNVGKEPIPCPSCGKALMRLSKSNTIFVLEE